MAVSTLHWPVDPALAATPDETRLARAVYATPLQTDDAGEVVPGLCDAWNASDGYRTWRFHCRDAVAIARELRRVARLRASPANWIFASAATIFAPTVNVVVVRLPFGWRRFPYALTTIAAAPRGVPGPFRVVATASNRVEVERDGMHLTFERMSRMQILAAMRRGTVDEAPVPLGDVGNFRALPALHVRPLLAVDVIAFRPGAIPADVRRAYWDTANRSDYQALVAQDGATAAFGLLGTAPADPAAYRRALKHISDLPRIAVRMGFPRDPTLAYGARLLYAQWREAGLGPQFVATNADAQLVRDAAVYPQDEALLGPLHLSASIGAVDQHAAFVRLDRQLHSTARVIPICWVADARWVSPRLRGWREDVLGDVDYTRVTVAG